MPYFRKQRSGFTLVEIMVTVGIMGMLASIAVPNFTRSMTEARYNEARINLRVIHTAQQVFRLNNNTFWGGATADRTIPQIDAGLGTSLNGRNFRRYTITGAAAAYTATVTGHGRTFTITETGALVET